MGKDSSPPPQTDYSGLAQQQGAANKDTAITQAILNNPNIVTPWGTQTVTRSAPGLDQASYDKAMADYNAQLTQYNATGGRQQVFMNNEDGQPMSFWRDGGGAAPVMPTKDSFMNGGTPQFTVTQQLSPEQQKLYEGQTKISQGFLDTGQTALGRVQDMFSQAPDQSSMQDVSDRSYAAQTSRLDPQWQEAAGQMETKLRNQGIPVGSDAWKAEMRQFDQGKNDAYTTARTTADATMPTIFQLAQAVRNQPLNEANALRTGAQVQTPQFQPFAGSNISPAPIMQAGQMQGQQAMNQYNQGVASSNSTQNGLFSLGSSAIMGGMMVF